MKNPLPLVSVIMPVYNSEKYLREAIDSILNQTYKNIELIIIDDGSSDNSINVVKSYNSEKIRFYINEKNMGVSSTRNKALDLSKGKYIALMDSDDISPLDRIEKQVEYLEKNSDFGLIGGHYESFTEYPFYTKRKFRKHCLNHIENQVNLNFIGSIAAPTAMFRNDIIKNNNIYFDTELKVGEDFDFWRQIGKFTKVTNIDHFLIRYRKHPSNTTKNKDLVDAHMTKSILKSLNDLEIDINIYFNEDLKIKDFQSFKDIVNKLKKFIITDKKFEKKYLEKSVNELIFWFYKRHVNLYGYKLYKYLLENSILKNRKIRSRDRLILLINSLRINFNKSKYY